MRCQNEKAFGFVFAGLFALIGLWPLMDGAVPSYLWLAASLLLFIITLISPRCLTSFARVWYALGHTLGWINTRLILGLVFFAIITPIGLILRAFRHDPLNLHQSNDWQPRSGCFDLESFKDQF